MTRFFQTICCALLPAAAAFSQTDAAGNPRPHRSYDIPGANNQSAKDPWDLWAFRIAADANFDINRNRDELPGTGPLRYRASTVDVGGTFRAFRTGRRFRGFGLLEGRFRDFDQSRTGANLNNPSPKIEFNLWQTGVWTPGQHFGLGLGLGGDWAKSEPSPFSPGQNDLAARLSAGIEFNLFKYGDFFRRYWLVGYYFHARNQGLSLYRGLEGGFFTKAAATTKWGYWSGSLELNPKTSGVFVGRLTLEGQGELGLNLRNGLYLTLTPSFRFSKSDSYSIFVPGTGGTVISAYEVQERFVHGSLNWGLNWYFGKGRANVLNPRGGGAGF